MIKNLILAATGAALAFAQKPATINAASAVAVGAQLRTPGAARPLLGYFAKSKNVLSPVVGSWNAPAWGEPLALPESTLAVFLPPRQEYALISQQDNLCMAELGAGGVSLTTPVSGAMARPDSVFFSPSGAAAALAFAEGKIQVLMRSGSSARVVSTVNFSDALQDLAISDDAALLVAQFADGPVVYSLEGSPWKPLPVHFSIGAWTFLPGTHDLIINERGTQTLWLSPHVESPANQPRTLASGVRAQYLVPNKQGSELLALSPDRKNAWKVDVTQGSATPIALRETCDSPALLRDGQSFLIPTQDSPAIIRLDSAAAIAAAGISR
jgi:hypothetical protein